MLPRESTNPLTPRDRRKWLYLEDMGVGEGGHHRRIPSGHDNSLDELAFQYIIPGASVHEDRQQLQGKNTCSVDAFLVMMTSVCVWFFFFYLSFFIFLFLFVRKAE